MFTAELKLRDAFVAAGKATGELVWSMPVDDEYKEGVQSEIATVKNIGPREGSACISASFVKTWAEETPFVHFDIAGTAWTTKPPAHLEAGATGFGEGRPVVREIVAYWPALVPREEIVTRVEVVE